MAAGGTPDWNRGNAASGMDTEAATGVLRTGSGPAAHRRRPSSHILVEWLARVFRLGYLPLIMATAWVHAADPAEDFARLLPLPMDPGTAERRLTDHLGRLPLSHHRLRSETSPGAVIFHLDTRRNLVLEVDTTRDPVGNIGPGDQASDERLR